MENFEEMENFEGMSRVCISKITGEIINAQSGGTTEDHLKTLSDNAVRAGYKINEIEVFYETDADFHKRKVQLLSDDEPLKQLREQRDKKLSEIDWWASSDLTMTADQTAYRKSLRDLPATASPSLDENGELTGVTWPEEPE
tara:strand:- start:781 stop:1206 length:426 start_codon:yes stop_codon:yes gene_type:complete